MAACCKHRKKQTVYTGTLYGLLFLVMGFFSNALAHFLTGIRMNLLYWWVTAAAVLLSMWATRQRFFAYNIALIRVFQICTAVAVMALAPVVCYPVLSHSVLWRVFSTYVVVSGFQRLMAALYVDNRFSQWVQHGVWRVEAGCLFLAGLSVAAYGINTVLFSAIIASVAIFSLWSSYPIQSANQRQAIDLAGSLTLAMGVSWGYSFLLLMIASWSGAPVGALYFCDCWKTMGVIMLGDQMRSHVSSLERDASEQSASIDGLLRHVIPLVIGAGYLSAVAWHIFLPQQGWLLPLRIFATVLVSACPCVISLAQPTVRAMYVMWSQFLPKSHAVNWSDRGPVWHALVQSNLALVRLYYLITVALSTGGSYLLFGVWMTPWTAGLCMLLGQLALVVNSALRVGMVMIQAYLLSTISSIATSSAQSNHYKPAQSSGFALQALLKFSQYYWPLSTDIVNIEENHSPRVH